MDSERIVRLVGRTRRRRSQKGGSNADWRALERGCRYGILLLTIRLARRETWGQSVA